jgi:GTP-binding protein
VLNEVFDLFAALDATDEQLDFPISTARAKNGWMAEKPEGPKDHGLAPLFDRAEARAAARRSKNGPFRMLGTTSKPTPFSAASSPAASPPAR